jgi:hypothetical protein
MAKRRGLTSGGEVVSGNKAHVIAIETLRTRANARATALAPMIRELQAAGKTTLRAIAEGLNDAGISTPLGQGVWSAVQVRRVLKRI